MSVRTFMVIGMLLVGSQAALAQTNGPCANLDDDAGIAACAKSIRTNPKAALRDFGNDPRAKESDDEDRPVARPRRAVDPTEAAIRGAIRRLRADD